MFESEKQQFTSEELGTLSQEELKGLVLDLQIANAKLKDSNSSLLNGYSRYEKKYTALMNTIKNIITLSE